MTKQQKAGPDFIGIGAQKCGTSWIGYVLSQHPGVHFQRKEVNFFVRHFHKGYGWYHKWFEGRGDKVAGEITPNYLYSPRPDAAHRQFYPNYFPRDAFTFWRKKPSALAEIAKHYQDVKLIAIFRNPIERAWSHYWMWRNRKERIGKSKQVRSFRRMFDDDGRWMRTQGFYGELLAPWLERFPNMAVYLQDDLKQDPLGLARTIYRYVGVDDTFTPEFEKRVNAGSYQEKISDEDRAHLIAVYREDNARFSELIDRDTSHWLAP
ncbi:MAG: sulfotransferase [Planctomycetes bacterium]|nr:sulfotransferase [Planctomycetota bacterium]